MFGFDAYTHIPKELQKKWEPKSRKGLFMGYSKTSKAYCISDVDRKITESRDVIFNKQLVPNPASNGTGRQIDDITPQKMHYSK